MADTLKAQHTALPDQGLRVLLGHGPHPLLDHRGHLRLARHALRRLRTRRWSARATAPRASRNSATTTIKNGYDSLLNELGKYGLGKRDLVANINFFSKVVADDAGDLQLRRGHSRAGQLRRPALRDEHAGGAAAVPASARPGARLSAARACGSRRCRAAPAAARRCLSHALPGERARLPQHRNAVCVRRSHG